MILLYQVQILLLHNKMYQCRFVWHMRNHKQLCRQHMLLQIHLGFLLFLSQMAVLVLKVRQNIIVYEIIKTKKICVKCHFPVKWIGTLFGLLNFFWIGATLMSLLYTKRAYGVKTKFNSGIYDEFIYITTTSFSLRQIEHIYIYIVLIFVIKKVWKLSW